MGNLTDDVGVVVIGRNEGERLKKSIQSIVSQVDKLIYVDSGSSDDSAEYVESMGLNVLRLDDTVPFSAARARNEGFRILKDDRLKYIQFIDGDCQCCEGWLSAAYNFLDNHGSFALVSGRRTEQFMQDSIYNTLCDIEWNTPIGEARTCGGDFMIRKEAFEQVGGFDSTVISGEEPELCYRLLKMGWRIFRLDHPMTVHDAAILRFSQWWKRSVRAGHAYAQGLLLHLKEGDGYCLKESARIWLWALFFPLLIFFLTIFVDVFFLLLIFVYLFKILQIALRMNIQIDSFKLSIVYAFFTVIGKWPELAGQLLYFKRRLFDSRHIIIEYS